MPSRKRQIKRPDIVRVFAERLRTFRSSTGLTQKDLATRAHITVSYVSTLEAGSVSPGIDLLERLAHALGVNVVDLLPGVVGSQVIELREDLRKRFDTVLATAGFETLSMMKTMLECLASSPVAKL